jgi:SagB-type dehydrogenase family enzyme
VPRLPSIAELFHEGTKYREETIRSLPLPDIAAQAPPHKDYHCEEPIDLVPDLPFDEFPLGPGPEQRPRDRALLPPVIGRLSRLLFFTGGATGISREEGESAIHLFRAAPSAGALYPTEIYLVPGPGSGLPDGVYDYAVHRHQLVPVFEGEVFEELSASCWDAAGFASAELAIVLTGVYARSSWRYHDRAYRRILLDTGHTLGNLCEAARSEGWRATPLASFEDERLSRLLFLDPAEEGVLVVVPLIPEEAAGGGGEEMQTPLRRSPISHGPVGEGESLLLACHRGTSIIRDDPVHAAGATPWPPLEEEARRAPIPLGKTLSDLGPAFRDTVLRRRSTRAFTGGTIGRDALAAILDHGHRAASPGPSRHLQAPERIASQVVV